jgi:signal transduction histidine kinase
MFHRLYFIFLCLVISLPGSVRANLDSLKKVYALSKNDTSGIMTCRSIAMELMYQNLDASEKYVDTLFLLAEKHKVPKGFWAAFSTKAAWLSMKGNMTEAIPMHEKAVAFAESLSDPKIYAKTVLNFANLLSVLPGKSEQALKQVRLARRLGEQVGDSLILSKSYVIEGTIHHTATDYRDAINCYYQALPILRDLQQDAPVVGDQITVLRNIATIMLALHDSSASLQYYTDARNLLLEHRNKVSPYVLAMTERDYITALVNSSKHTKAKTTLKALEDSPVFGVIYEYFPPSAFHILKAKILLQDNQWKDAIQESDKAILAAGDFQPSQKAIALLSKLEVLFRIKDWSGMRGVINQFDYFLISNLTYSRDISTFLTIKAQNFEAQKDFNKSSMTWRELVQFQDSVLRSDMQAEILRLSEDYQASERKQDLIRLKSEKLIYDKIISDQRTRIQFVAVLLLALCTIIIGLIYFQRRLQKKNIQLQELIRLKNDFLQMAAHDLKSPLANIRLYVSLLQSNTESPDSGRNRLGVIKKSIDRMYEMVHRLLSVHLYNSGMLANTRLTFSLATVIRQLVQEYAPSIESKKLQVQLELSSESMMFNNMDAVSHLVENLLSNAIKYNPEAGRIFISVKENKDQVVFKIQDEAGGVDFEALAESDSITDLTAHSHNFAQVSGIGLSIVRRLVNYTRAVIQVDRFQSGSQFSLTWPKYMDENT